jgi:hypothetical protein
MLEIWVSCEPIFSLDIKQRSADFNRIMFPMLMPRMPFCSVAFSCAVIEYSRPIAIARELLLLYEKRDEMEQSSSQSSLLRPSNIFMPLHFPSTSNV